MLKESIDKKTLYLLKLSEKVIEFLVIVFLDTLYFLSHGSQFGYLIFDLVLELCDFALQVLHRELVEHDNFVVTMLAKQAFKAN